VLNGIAPIIIFNFKKLLPALQELTSGIPLLADVTEKIPLVPIPIYLDEKITGLYIDQENKNIDVNTETKTLPDGTAPKVQQTGINSTITINMQASANSIGLSVLSAMMDLIFEKLTSQEYSITYLHKAVTVFNGLLEGYSISQNSNNDLYSITLTISRVTGSNTTEKAAAISVPKVGGVVLP
jgi:hypothetical protein